MLTQKGGKLVPYPSLLGLLVLIGDVWAIINVVQSGADSGKKVLWVVLIVVLPVLGLVLWWFLGPRTGRA